MGLLIYLIQKRLANYFFFSTNTLFGLTSNIEIMKNILFYLVIFGIVLSCSQNDEPDLAVLAEGFEFSITGEINKTISGPIAYFNSSTAPDIFGEDLNTVSFSAVDSGKGQVSFGITTYDLIGKGTYPIEIRIAPEAYNGYVNFVEDPTTSPIFGPVGGSIKLSQVSDNEISGFLDVSCQEQLSGKSISIKGTFTSIRQ